MPETASAVVTPEQYRPLQRPRIKLPSPQELFDCQVENLVAKQLAEYKHADPFRKKLPKSGLFVFVPPKPSSLDLKYLMSLVEVAGKKGANYLEIEHLKDIVDVPKGAYIMDDVEDGAQRLNTKPSVSQKNIKREGRSPFITYEGIVIAVSFPVLKDHNMDLLGSRYKSGCVPVLGLVVGKPGLNVRTSTALPIRSGVLLPAGVALVLDPRHLGPLGLLPLGFEEKNSRTHNSRGADCRTWPAPRFSF